MRWTTGLLLLLLGSWGCSGRYEVGALQQNRGDVGSAGSASTQNGSGSSSEGSAAGKKAIGSEEAAGGGAEVEGTVDEFGPGCVPAGQPGPIAGDFAAPAEVWARVSRLVWGEPHEPPSALPATTTYEWAGDLVTQTFAEARPGLHAFGANQFVARWLDPNGFVSQPDFVGGWETLLIFRVSALQQLLTASLPLSTDGQRVGVFSEPAWLEAHPSISGRGAAMLFTLFQTDIRTPVVEEGLEAFDDPTLTERKALEVTVAPDRCLPCHRLFDPLGYALGRYDAAGKHRELERGLEIDTSGSYALKNRTIYFDGIEQLGHQLLDTCDATVGLADGFLRAALIINEEPEPMRAPLFEASAPRVRQAFVHSGLRSYEDLVRAYAQSPAALLRSPQ